MKIKFNKKTIAIIGFTFLVAAGTACSVITTSCSKKSESYDMSLVNEMKEEMTPAALDEYTSQAVNDYKRQLWKTCTDDTERAQATIEAEEFGQKIDDDVAALPADSEGWDKFDVINQDACAEGIDLLDYTYIINHKEEYLAKQREKINKIPGLNNEQKRDLFNQVEINFDKGTGDFRDDNMAAGAWLDAFNEEADGLIQEGTDEGLNCLTAQALSSLLENQGVLLQHKTVNNGLDLRTLGAGHELSDDEMGKMFSYEKFEQALDSDSLTGYKLTMTIASIQRKQNDDKVDSLYAFDISFNFSLCPTDKLNDAANFTQTLGEPISYAFNNSVEVQNTIAASLYNDLGLSIKPWDQRAYYQELKQQFAAEEKNNQLFLPVNKESLAKIYNFNTNSDLFRAKGMNVALRFYNWNDSAYTADVEFRIVDAEDTVLLSKTNTDSATLFGDVGLYSDDLANLVLNDARINLKNNLAYFTFCSDSNLKIRNDFHNWTIAYQITQITVAALSAALAVAYLILSAGLSPYFIGALLSAALAIVGAVFAVEAQVKSKEELKEIVDARESAGPYLQDVLKYMTANEKTFTTMYKQFKVYNQHDSASVKKMFVTYRKFSVDQEKALAKRKLEENLYLTLLALFVPSADTYFTDERIYIEQIENFLPSIFDANVAAAVSGIISVVLQLPTIHLTLSLWAVLTLSIADKAIPLIMTGTYGETVFKSVLHTYHALVDALTPLQLALAWAVAIVTIIIVVVSVSTAIINFFAISNNVLTLFNDKD